MHNELKKHGIVMTMEEDIGISFISTKPATLDLQRSLIYESIISNSSEPNHFTESNSHDSKQKMHLSYQSLNSEQEDLKIQETNDLY